MYTLNVICNKAVKGNTDKYNDMSNINKMYRSPVSGTLQKMVIVALDVFDAYEKLREC